MQYSAALPFRGKTDKAFDLAEAALTTLGFRIAEKTAGSSELIGPGMNSTRQNPLVGASRIKLIGRSAELALEAELGGVEWMKRFVLWFPLGMILFLGVVLSIVFSVVFGPGTWLSAVAIFVGANALLWLILGPLMARRMKDRTCNALDALLNNMVAVGEAS